MRIVIIGGSAAGLTTGLMLARDGHEVEVVDRDDLEPAADVEAAAKSGLRPAAPQLVQAHSYLPLARNILLDRLPDVHAALLEAGAVEAVLTNRMPPTLADRSPRPGDERLVGLLARRTTVDWVLRSAAAAEPNVRLIGRCRVTGLLAHPGKPPRVVGVRTRDGERLADVVVDASGRRSRIDRWLGEIGARPPQYAFAKCGVSYYTRHYQLRPDATRPAPGQLLFVGYLRMFSVAGFTADNDTMTLTIAPLAEDRPMRALRNPAVHDAVARTVGPLSEWLDIAEPASPVYAMGGLNNALRRLVVDDQPAALGLHAVGDAVCTTNPTFGRGIPLALQGATDLSAVLAGHPDRPRAQTHAMDASVTEHIAPWYAEQAAADGARLDAVRRALRNEPPAPPPDPADGVTFAHLAAVGTIDPEVFRAFSSVLGMLRQPAERCSDPDIVTRVRAAFAAGAVPPPMQGPSRAELLAALEASP